MHQIMALHLVANFSSFPCDCADSPLSIFLEAWLSKLVRIILAKSFVRQLVYSFHLINSLYITHISKLTVGDGMVQQVIYTVSFSSSTSQTRTRTKKRFCPLRNSLTITMHCANSWTKIGFNNCDHSWQNQPYCAQDRF